MSRIRANRFTNKSGNGAPLFTDGVNVVGLTSLSNVTAGVSTVTTLNASSGSFTGNVTATGSVTAGNVAGTTGTFSGNVSIGGTLTYEDVTNVDSVGIVTARGGLTTQKLLKEEVNVTAGKLSDNTNIYLENGCVHIFTTAESTTSTPAIKYNASTNLKDKMSVGESVVVTLVTTANASAYSAQITIDGDAVTENWIGGSAPSAGGSSGVDIHTFTIIKVASSGTTDQQLTVIANHSKTS
jgi:hypothetical protein